MYNILDFKAVEGGIVNNTLAINAAIKECNKNGGGKVVVPRGVFLTGPLKLLSNVILEVEKGALLFFSKSKEEYPLDYRFREGAKALSTIAPISAKNAINIGIIGEGIIDGSGHLWRMIKQNKQTKKEWEENLKISPYVIDTSEGGIWFPTKSSYEGCLKQKDIKNISDGYDYYDFFRPNLVDFEDCRNIILENVTFQNSPMWGIHFLFCEKALVNNIKVKNPYYAQSCDGIDIESCQNIEITNSYFEVGDDAICLKAGKGKEALEIQKPCCNITISNNTVYKAHGGFTIGSETARGIYNVTVNDNVFINTDIGFRFKSAKGRCGVIKNITLSNNIMHNILKEAIIFDLHYSLYKMDHEEKDIIDDVEEIEIPEMKDIYIDNLKCTSCQKGLVIDGLEEKPIRHIVISNSIIFEKEEGYCHNIMELIKSNVVIKKITD